MSVSRLTVWLHKDRSISNLGLCFFWTDTQWLWTGTRDFWLDEPQDSPKLFVTKSLQNKRLTLTANIFLLYGNYSSSIPPRGLLLSPQQHSCKPTKKILISSLLIFKQLCPVMHAVNIHAIYDRHQDVFPSPNPHLTASNFLIKSD